NNQLVLGIPVGIGGLPPPVLRVGFLRQIGGVVVHFSGSAKMSRSRSCARFSRPVPLISALFAMRPRYAESSRAALPASVVNIWIGGASGFSSPQTTGMPVF